MRRGNHDLYVLIEFVQTVNYKNLKFATLDLLFRILHSYTVQLDNLPSLDLCSPNLHDFIQGHRLARFDGRIELGGSLVVSLRFLHNLGSPHLNGCFDSVLDLDVGWRSGREDRRTLANRHRAAAGGVGRCKHFSCELSARIRDRRQGERKDA